MILHKTKLYVADNSGAKIVKCIRIFKISSLLGAKAGEVCLVVIKNFKPNRKVNKKEIHRGLIIRTKKEIKRSGIGYLKFDNNVVVLINSKNLPIGTRIFGSVVFELRNDFFMKIVSLAAITF